MKTNFIYKSMALVAIVCSAAHISAVPWTITARFVNDQSGQNHYVPIEVKSSNLDFRVSEEALKKALASVLIQKGLLAPKASEEEYNIRLTFRGRPVEKLGGVPVRELMMNDPVHFRLD